MHFGCSCTSPLKPGGDFCQLISYAGLNSKNTTADLEPSGIHLTMKAGEQMNKEWFGQILKKSPITTATPNQQLTGRKIATR